MTEATQPPRRGRPALRYNKEAAQAYGIDPDMPDPPRELIRVDEIPTPPMVQATGTPRPEQAALNLEDTVLTVLREEMDELAARLAHFGVGLDTHMRQELVDIAMALLSGHVGGGAVASR